MGSSFLTYICPAGQMLKIGLAANCVSENVRPASGENGKYTPSVFLVLSWLCGFICNILKIRGLKQCMLAERA